MSKLEFKLISHKLNLRGQMSNLIVKCWLLALSSIGLAAPAQAQTAPEAPACPPLLQHTIARLQDEKPQNLCQ